MLALNELCRRMPEIEVVFAGWDVSGYEIPFKHRNLGIVTPQVLADSYAICDMCLVISNTNLSLVPFEVMACNSVAVCSKGANSSWMVNEENSILVDYDPIQIADRMEYTQHRMSWLHTQKEWIRKELWYKKQKSYASMLKGIEEMRKN